MFRYHEDMDSFEMMFDGCLYFYQTNNHWEVSDEIEYIKINGKKYKNIKLVEIEDSNNFVFVDSKGYVSLKISWSNINQLSIKVKAQTYVLYGED